MTLPNWFQYIRRLCCVCGDLVFMHINRRRTTEINSNVNVRRITMEKLEFMIRCLLRGLLHKLCIEHKWDMVHRVIIMMRTIFVGLVEWKWLLRYVQYILSTNEKLCNQRVISAFYHRLTINLSNKNCRGCDNSKCYFHFAIETMS